ncbi:MAG: EVE domain-containing protein [Nitriliruptorales bacterium]|nr:EVE domain-containing protein [Nitriliruptorales bacterium]
MTTWCLTTSPDNFARTAELGWKLQGIKSRRGNTAREIHPGDKLVYYVTKHVAFGAIAVVTSEVFEDHDPIWTSKPGEDYPWRFPIQAELVITDPTSWVPAEELREELEFPRKWPPEHWKLAFQGNIRQWPDHDYEVVKAALGEAVGQRR